MNKKMNKEDLSDYSKTLLKVEKIVGSFETIGKLCGFNSGRVIYRWFKQGSPPRTEYSGETQYAHILSKQTNGEVSENDLRPLPRLHNMKMRHNS